MNNRPQRYPPNLVIPRGVVVGIVTGILAVLLSYVFTQYAGATTGHSPIVTSRESALSTGSSYWQALDTHAHIIVYRSDTAASPSASSVLNVFINNRYHTSVLPQDRAVELALCPGKKSFGVSLSHLSQHRYARPGAINGVSPELDIGERYYLQVTLDAQGKISTRWVPQPEAEMALMHLNSQKRTLSRVVKERDCPEVIYSINTDKLYVSQQGRSMELSEPGNAVLADLVKTIEKEFFQIDKVVVRNHSEVNEILTVEHPLSQMRTNSVATWLVNSDINAPVYQAEGKDLKNCHDYSASRYDDQACLKYRRSVDIEVYGVKKTTRSLH
jgi:hypothetical protein